LPGRWICVARQFVQLGEEVEELRGTFSARPMLLWA
jgi:hypothetical protein